MQEIDKEKRRKGKGILKEQRKENNGRMEEGKKQIGR